MTNQRSAAAGMDGLLGLATLPAATVVLRDYQLDTIARVTALIEQPRPDGTFCSRVLVVSPTGCHAAGQGILLHDGGVVAVEDVRLHHRLMGPDGQPRRVLDLHRGRQTMARIVPVKGDPFVVNLDHVLSLVRVNDGGPHAGRVTDVTVRELLGWSNTQRHVHKLFRAGVDFPSVAQEMPLEPYFLGVLLGDGAIKYASVGVSKGDPEIESECRRQAAAFGLMVRIDVLKRPTGTSTTIFLSGTRNVKNPIMARLEALGLRGTGSESKFVPPQYKVGTRAGRLEILAGLMDTDGSMIRGGFDYLSQSETLSRDVAFIARSVGLAAYVRPCEKRDQNGHGGTYWRVGISGDCSVIPTRIPRKQSPPRRQIKNVLRTGFVVELLAEDDYYGFELDGDGRYLLGDFTVTHNSGKTVVFSHILHGVVARGGTGLVLAHRQELISQAYEKLTGPPPFSYGIPRALVGVIMGDDERRNPSAPIQIASIDTLRARVGRARRAGAVGGNAGAAPVAAATGAEPAAEPPMLWSECGLPPATVIMVDEAHRAITIGHAGVLSAYPDSIVMGFSVGPVSAIELRGGPFGRGWSGPIESAFAVALPTAKREVDANGYELLDTRGDGIEARGWTGTAFGWKTVKTMIRHACDKPVRELKINGAHLLLTDDHSVYRVEPSGQKRRVSTGIPRDVGAIRECETAAVAIGDVLPQDDGSYWESGIAEAPFSMLDIAPSGSLVAVDLSAATRKEIGANSKDWWNFRHSGAHGHYLPIDTYRRHATTLPKPKRIYTTHAYGAWVAPVIALSSWAYVLGFWLGDGWTDSGRVCFAVEDSRVDYFVRQVSSLPGLSWNPDVRDAAGAAKQVRCASVIVTKALHTIFGKVRAWEKWVPGEWIMSWSHAARIELLHGLIDSDGHVHRADRNRSRVYYVTTSRRLAESIVVLLRSVGAQGSISARAPRQGGVVQGRQIISRRPAYCVDWSLSSMLGRNDGRYGARSRFVHGDMKYREAVVKDVRAAERPTHVYDLEMDGHPSFVANGVLVHNTASPIRLDGQGLRPQFDALVVAASTAELIAGGHLAKARGYSHRRAPSAAGLASKGGDFDDRAGAAAMDKPELIGDLVEHWLKRSGLAPTIVFAASVEHSRNIRDQFLAQGIPCAHVDGATPPAERKAALDGLRSGRLRVVTNCNLFLEGTDVVECKCVVWARFTKSVALWLQGCGRAARTIPGLPEIDTYIVIDHGGNWRRLDAPERDRDWSLDGAPKRDGGGGDAPAKDCPGCDRMVDGFARVCEFCGWEFGEAAGPRGLPQHRAGELVEMTEGEKAARKELRRRLAARCARADEERGWRYGTANKIVNNEWNAAERDDMSDLDLKEALRWMSDGLFAKRFPLPDRGGEEERR